MTTPRKRYIAELKAKVVLEAIKGHKTMNEKGFNINPMYFACLPITKVIQLANHQDLMEAS